MAFLTRAFLLLLLLSPKFLAAESESPDFFREEALAEVVAKSGCKVDSVQLQDVFLRSGVIDKVGFCPEKCGIHGCTYSLFLRVPKTPDLYRASGLFSGVYEVLKSSTHGHRDLKLIQRFSAEEQREQILRFNGNDYR